MHGHTVKVCTLLTGSASILRRRGMATPPLGHTFYLSGLYEKPNTGEVGCATVKTLNL